MPHRLFKGHIILILVMAQCAGTQLAPVITLNKDTHCPSLYNGSSFHSMEKQRREGGSIISAFLDNVRDDRT